MSAKSNMTMRFALIAQLPSAFLGTGRAHPVDRGRLDRSTGRDADTTSHRNPRTNLWRAGVVRPDKAPTRGRLDGTQRIEI